jgi:hypothetical protein
MVFTNKYTKILMINFSNFAISDSLKELIEFSCDDGVVNACLVFTGLTDYITVELVGKYQKITQEEIDIYHFVEEMRLKYSLYPEKTAERDFDDAICACFLENLLNRASGGMIMYSRFIPYLGEKSKEYCRAWDEFTGIKSPGLWN